MHQEVDELYEPSFKELPILKIERKANLSEYLVNWSDFDVAEFYLGVVLGLWEDTQEAFQSNKWIFWSNNLLGNSLFQLLEDMVRNNILMKNNSRFKICDLEKLKIAAENT